MAPPVPIRAMSARIRSLAVTPVGERSVELHRERLRLALQQALGGQDVADLARADAEGEGAEGPVRAGVAVAADDGRARVREAQLRPDHVDDALPLVAHPVEGDAELAAVPLEGRDLLGRRPLRRAPGGRPAPRAWGSRGPSSPPSARGAARAGPARAAPRRPAATSPRGRGAGPRRGRPAPRPSPPPPGARPRSCRGASACRPPWPAQAAARASRAAATAER